MKVIIPENISEITLEQYQQYDKLIKRTDLNDRDVIYRTVKIFTGLPFKIIAAMKYKDLEDIVGILTKTLQTESVFQNRFKINNVEFGFIPNFDDIKAKEYFDLSEYSESNDSILPNSEYQGSVDNLHKLMAILFRPIQNKDALGNYSIVDYQGTSEWAEVMKRTPLNVVNGALGFFLTLSQELQTYTQKYLEKVKAEKEMQRETISKNGDGTQQYINYQGVKDGSLITSKT